MGKRNFYLRIRTILILFLIALVLRLGAIIYWQFDGLYGQDPYAYLRQGLALAEQLSPPTDFFWPNGYPLLIALLTPFMGQTALAGQTVTLLCGTALVPLTFLLTRDLFFNTMPPPTPLSHTRTNPPYHRTFPNPRKYGYRAGVLAALILSVAGQPILSSIVVMADIPALFWATLATWSLVRAVRLDSNRSTGWFFIGGIALGMAIISRWIYILIIPALILYTFYHLRSKFWWQVWPLIVGSVMIIGPQLWFSFAYKPEGIFHSWLLNWHPINYFLRQFETVDGYHTYSLPMALFYTQSVGHPAYIFPLLGLTALWAIRQFIQAKQWGLLLLLMGWILPVYLFLAGIPYQNFRFGLTHYLPLLILTSYGLADLLQENRQPKKTRRRSSQDVQTGQLGARALAHHHALAFRFATSQPVTYTIITISLLIMLLWSYTMLDQFLTLQKESKLIAHQVEQTLPSQATVISFGLTLTLQHYTDLSTLELFYLDEPELEQLIEETESPLYLLLDPNNIQTQWRDKVPAQNYLWLKEHTHLSRQESFAPYVLFKVENP